MGFGAFLFLVSLSTSACAKNLAPVFFEIPETQKSQWNEPIPENKTTPSLTDVYAHRSPWENGIVYVEGHKVSLMLSPSGTIAHELIHGINNYWRSMKSLQATFYVPYQGGVILKETKAKRIHLSQFIPEELRGIDGNGGRFYQYIETQSGKEPDAGTYFDPSNGKKLWGETTAYYIWDEWNAYIYGGRTDLEAEERFGKESWDSLTGPVEFMIYSLAGLMAMEKEDPAYFHSQDFHAAKDLFAFFAEETKKLLSDGKNSSLSPEKAERYLEVFRTSQSPKAKAMRDFLTSQKVRLYFW
jgi:hypothetical protein